MKKVLLIVYYWPPAGGGGVQRWVKHVKYLRQFGWEPVVYIPENPSYPLIDETLAQDVPNDITIVKHKIWEPYEYYNKLTGSKNSKTHAGFISEANAKPSMMKKLANWVRGNYFIPDARKFWIKPSIKYLSKYLRANQIEHIITTGPPMSMHLIGLGLKRKLGVKWLADFRDAWVNMDFREDFHFTPASMRKHEALEAAVIKEASCVAASSWNLAKQYEQIRGGKVEPLTNGFDTEDFKDANAVPINPNKFVIGHYGTLGKDRNPQSLWKAIANLLKEQPTLKELLLLEFIGPTDGSIHHSLQEHGLYEMTHFVDYMEHHEVIHKMQAAGVLLLVVNQNASEEGRIPGKIFEYLASKRPILGLGSVTSDCAKILSQTQAGQMIAFDDESQLKAFIAHQYDRYRQQQLTVDPAGLEQFTRKHLAGSLAKMLEDM